MNKGKLVFAQAMEHVPLSICAIAKTNAVPRHSNLVTRA